jgi:hypothetical protein
LAFSSVITLVLFLKASSNIDFILLLSINKNCLNKTF